MIRIVIIFLIAVVVFAVLRIFLGRKKLSVNQFFSIYGAVMLGLVLVYFGATGRLHWLFALLGAGLPVAARFLSLINMAQSFSRASQFMQGMSSGFSGPTQGQTSELTTEFFSMVLEHDSGNMDGRILKGQLANQLLSDLNLTQLSELYREVTVDTESIQVLEAYLDRQHPDWQDEFQPGAENAGAHSHHNSEGRHGSDSADMTRQQAFEILGLTPDASMTDIINAHRRLMQKLHPDRGGSTWLAARINLAKDMLTND